MLDQLASGICICSDAVDAPMVPSQNHVYLPPRLATAAPVALALLASV
jgi:hypothetical protein